MIRGNCIRQVTGHDPDALFSLEQLAFDSDRFTRNQIDYLLSESGATTFMLENRKPIMGAACILRRKSHQGARLYNMAVDLRYKRRNIGKKLLGECELEAAHRECKKMTLEIHEDDHGAVRFYEKQGHLFKC